MNTLPVCGGAPQWLHELAAAKTHYEEMFGWPVTVRVAQRVLAAPVGGVLDVVTMPALLGGKVLAELQLTTRVGLVIATPDNVSWMFFTQPVKGPGRHLPSELSHLRAHLIPKGTYVVIPTHIDSDSGPRWIKQPQAHRSLPPWSAIVGITRRVAAKLISNEPAVSAAREAADEHRLLIAS